MKDRFNHDDKREMKDEEKPASKMKERERWEKAKWSSRM